MKEILLGKGYDSLKFGMTRAEVEEILGKPDEIDSYANSEEEGDNTEAYHYDKIELSVSFDEIDDWKLTSIAVSDSDSDLDGLKLIGVSSSDLLEKIDALALGEYEREDVSSPESPDNEVVSFMGATINFWIYQDKDN